MENKTLKIIAANSIIENKDLSKESKKQYLNFILKEANEIQLKSLVLDQKIYTNLDEDAKEIINKRFNNFISEDIVSMAVVIAIGAMVYHRFYSKAAKECRHDPQKSLCMQKYKVMAIKKQLEAIRSNIPKCKNVKDPQKCENIMKKQLENTTKYLQKNEITLNQIMYGRDKK